MNGTLESRPSMIVTIALIPVNGTLESRPSAIGTIALIPVNGNVTGTLEPRSGVSGSLWRNKT